MDQFTSPSDARNFYKDAYSTFQGMAVDAEGALITAERKGARASVTKKGLVVRYPSPFVGGEPEILFEHTKSLSSTAVDPGGAIHVLSNDSRHHTNESGTWKAHKIGAEGGHFQIGVVKDTLFLHGTGLRRRMASSYDIEALPESASRVDSIAGRSVNDIYLTTGAGLFHHGDSGWTCVDDTFLGGTLCQDGDAWLTTARRPGSKVVLYRGSAQTGFSELVHQDAVECEEPGDLGYDPAVFRALGKVFVTGSRGVWLLEGERLRRVVVSTGWNGARGDERYLWVANGTELLCFDGNTWKITPRVLDT